MHCPSQRRFLARGSEGHDARRTVRSRSQGRRPATRQMRQEVEFRFYEGRSEGPQRPERNMPALLQGGGEALMFGDSGGPGPMNETRRQKSDKASKLGSAPIAVHQSAVPPADHGQELAEAAPLESHAPMEPWPETSRTSGRLGLEASAPASEE